jgi:hypothetical protein
VGISTSLFLIAVGAILAFAVDVNTRGFDVNTIGVILMIVGGLGALLSLVFWGSWGGFGRREVYVERGVPRGRVVQDDIL